MSNEEIQVRITRLEPMRIASVYGFGTGPEDMAREKLVEWAKPKGFLDIPGEHRIFGFNNPNPSHGSPNYGYEFWITVGEDVEPEGDIRIQEFHGGLYAVTGCSDAGENGEKITDTWMQFYRWVQDSKYNMGTHQWLEEHTGKFPAPMEELVLDLYLPVLE